MEVTLKILKEDIESSLYCSNTDCAIARAFKRAGFPEIEVGGTSLYNGSKRIDIPQFHELSIKVLEMYHLDTQPNDFEVILNLDL